MELINKVAQKNIITLDLEKFYPSVEDILYFDLKNYLFKELILKEGEFRDALKQIDWGKYSNKHVVLFCSNKAIIPMWAFMLVTAYLNENNAEVYASAENIEEENIVRSIHNLPLEEYRDERIIIKGCGDKNLSPKVYLSITQKLQPITKSIMYGEACSTVPIYKK